MMKRRFLAAACAAPNVAGSGLAGFLPVANFVY